MAWPRLRTKHTPNAADSVTYPTDRTLHFIVKLRGRKKKAVRSSKPIFESYVWYNDSSIARTTTGYTHVTMKTSDTMTAVKVRGVHRVDG